MRFRTDTAPQDWPAIAAHLAALDKTLTADPPRQFAGGLANLNYLVTLDGAPAVFRRPPAGELAHGASDMAREARVLAALAGEFALAPKLLHFCDDAGVIGVPFQLIEFRHGAAIGGELRDGFTAADGRWMTAELTGAMAALHALDPDAVGLGDLGRPDGFAARQLDGWTRRAQAAFDDAAPPALAALLAELEQAMPRDAPPRLLHMDPKFDNLLLDGELHRATALIDWDMATLGPPAFDLAVLLSYWVQPGDPEPLHALGAVPSLTPGWPTRAAVVAAYADAAGGVPPDLGWHMGLARLRLAVAWRQLHRLWRRGDLAGERYAGFAALSDAVLDHATADWGTAP